LVKLAVALIGLSAIIAAPIGNCAAAVVRITDDHGGNIGAYWSRYTALRANGDQIVIDGTCSSACTLVLGLIPSSRICVTRNAVLGFHAAWQSGFLGLPVINEPATRTLMSAYPTPIRRWITRHGGLGANTIYLSGRDLMALYQQCR
jgi:hypothetical protein